MRMPAGMIDIHLWPTVIHGKDDGSVQGQDGGMDE